MGPLDGFDDLNVAVEDALIADAFEKEQEIILN